MRKLLCVFIIAICLGWMPFCYATDAPFYDAVYENFYANGNAVVIDIDNENNTLVTWKSGSQIVPSTVTVFGGGSDGSFYENTNIVMNGGVVSNIAGGGVSVQEDLPAIVTNSNITINNGTVLSSVMGGGFLYAEVNNSNVVINGGTVAAVGGGGMASATVNGQYYSIGSEEDMPNSPNRTNDVSVTINGGVINSLSVNYGLVYGGGQGYSYVGDTNLVITSGDMTSAYVTAGGSNGYTGNSNVTISGGNIMLYQSVNRGIVEDATTEVTGGTIEKFYIGGETQDPTVTGTIDKVEVALLDGKIGVLEAGKSNSEPITIDQGNYMVMKTDDMEILNDTIPEAVVEVEYQVEVQPQEIRMNVNENMQLDVIVTTVPSEYQRFFDCIAYECGNAEIATVTEEGMITALKEGETTVTVSLLEEERVVNVVVEPQEDLICLLVLVGVLMILFAILATQSNRRNW